MVLLPRRGRNGGLCGVDHARTGDRMNRHRDSAVTAVAADTAELLTIRLQTF